MDTEGMDEGMSQGGLKWVAEIDYSRLQQDAKDIEDTITGIGSRAKAEASDITQAVNSTGRAAEQQMNALDRIGSRLTGLMAGVASVTMFKNFAETVAGVRSQMESMQSSFESLLGDAQKGDRLFSDIKRMAATTPLSMDSLAQAAQTMLAFNISGEKIMPMLQALGDISMGDSARFQSLALAFSQMSSAGHLMAQDMRQMISAGFNPLQEMARTTGKSIAELTDEMSKGEITSQQVEQAFISATSQGGRFDGMLEKQSKGIRGAIQQFRSAWEEMLDDIGKTNEGPMVKIVDLATEMVKHYKAIGAVLAGLIATYGTYKAVIMACTVAETLKNLSTIAEAKSEAAAADAAAGHTAAMVAETVAAKAATVAQTLLVAAQKAGPYLAVAAAITAVAVAVYKMAHQESEAQKRQKILNDAMSEAASKYAEEKANIDMLFGSLKAAKRGTDEYYQARQAILTQFPEIAKSQDAHIRNLEDVAGAYKLVTDNALKAAQAEAIEGAIKSEQQLTQQETQKNLDTLNKYIDKKYKNRPGVEDFKAQADIAVISGQQLLPKYYHKFDTPYGGNMFKSAQMYESKYQGAETDFMRGVQKSPGYQTLQKMREQAQQDNTPQIPTIKGGGSTGSGKSGGSGESAADIAKEAQERQQAITDAKADIMKTQRDAELDIRQQQLDLMDDSVDKAIQRNKLDIDKLKAQNEDRLQEYVKQFTALRKAQWEQANPDAEKKGKTFEKDSGFDIDKLVQKNADGTLKSTDKLLQSMLDKYNAYGKVIQQTQLNLNKETYRQLLDGVETSEQQRADIVEKWDKRIAALREAATVKGSGVTQANVDLAEASKNWELFKSSAQYLNFFNATLAESNKQIEAAGQTIKANLDDSLRKGAISAKDYEDEMEKINQILDKSRDRQSNFQAFISGGLTGLFDNKLNVSEDKFNEAVQNYDKASGDYAAALKKGDTAAANQAKSAMKTAASQKSAAASAVAGAKGALSTVQAIDTIIQSVNGTVQGIYQSFEDIKDLASSFGANTGANTGWGAAQAFLGAFSKASQGATDAWNSLKSGNIAGVLTGVTKSITSWFTTFNAWHDAKLQEKIEGLQHGIDDISFSLENVPIERLDERFGTATQRIEDMFRATGGSAKQAAKEWDGLQRSMSRAGVAQIRFTQSAERLAQIYANLGYTADKAIGGQRYAEATDRLRKLAQQQLLIQRQIELDHKKKKKNREQEKKWQEEQEKLAQESVDTISDMVDDIVGKSSNDIASELGDAFIDAFTKGEDAAQAWGDKVNDIVADILKRMLVQKFLEEPLGKLFDKYKKQWFPNGNGSMTIDNVTKSLPQFEKDLDGLESDFSKVVGQLPEKYRKQLESVNGSTVEASQKGIAQASQDSVDELDGRMTAVQEHTYHINANTRIIAANTQALLHSVLNIERETSGFSDRLKRMETSLGNMSTAISDMSVKGVTLKTRV